MVERFDINKHAIETKAEKYNFPVRVAYQSSRTMLWFPRFPRIVPIVFPFSDLAFFFFRFSLAFFFAISAVKYRGKYVALDLFAVEAAS